MCKIDFCGGNPKLHVTKYKIMTVTGMPSQHPLQAALHASITEYVIAITLR